MCIFVFILNLLGNLLLRPSIRFSSDEAVAFRLATNEIQVFDAADFSEGISHRLRIPGLAVVELFKAPRSHVAAFVPESKGGPGNVQIYACGKELQSQPLVLRSFFRCSTVQLNWNHGSTGLLVVVQSDVDKTNQSYYRESKLNYLTTDGTHEGLMPLRKEGPLIHDLQWSFSGKEFAVVYGFTPASATIFEKKCKPLLELGSGPHNTIRWNPKGKCILS